MTHNRTFNRLPLTAQKLYEEMNSVPVIDAHEHLPLEEDHLQVTFSLSDVFEPYAAYDMRAAGLFENAGDYSNFRTGEDWRKIEPFWKATKFGCYGRALRITLEKWWGIEDITGENYQKVVEAFNTNNRPGLYDKALRNECQIQAVLTQTSEPKETADPLLRFILPAPVQFQTAGDIKTMEKQTGQKIRNLGDIEEVIISRLHSYAKRIYAIKLISGSLRLRYSRELAEDNFASLLSGGKERGGFLMGNGVYAGGILSAYLADVVLRYCAENDIRVAVHAGVWGDFTKLKPTILIPWLERYPDVQFDLYHLGLPYSSEAAYMAKNYHNLYLNLCWAHIISAEHTMRMLHEIIDLVPLNKIFAFGGDFTSNPEKVFGHLVMAKENLARVLGERIDRDLMNREDALWILRLWLWENPVQFYRLKELQIVRGQI